MQRDPSFFFFVLSPAFYFFKYFPPKKKGCILFKTKRSGFHLKKHYVLTKGKNSGNAVNGLTPAERLKIFCVSDWMLDAAWFYLSCLSLSQETRKGKYQINSVKAQFNFFFPSPLLPVVYVCVLFIFPSIVLGIFLFFSLGRICLTYGAG